MKLAKGPLFLTDVTRLGPYKDNSKKTEFAPDSLVLVKHRTGPPQPVYILGCVTEYLHRPLLVRNTL
jgi:hypothetical protein